MKLKRTVFLVHRWLGVAMCLFFLMWFISGIVMMYVAFPSLTPQERLAGLPNLNAKAVLFAPHSLIEEVGADNVSSLRLTTLLNRPAYLLKTKAGEFHGAFADTGESIADITAEKALLAAQLFYQYSQAEGNSKPNIAQENITLDQWTVSGSLNAHRPLHKIALNDAEGTYLYVSTKTGEVVRDTSRHERIWNWLGANLHWIYPVQLRQHPSVWHWVVVVLSFLGIFSVVSGSIVGLMRLRLRKRYRGKDITPYQGVNKYHHLIGLACFIFLFTYIFSGLLSMNPFGVFNSNASCQINENIYAGNLEENNTQLYQENIQELIKSHTGLKEIRFYWIANKVYPLGVTQNTRQLLTAGKPSMQVVIESAISKANFHCNANKAIVKTSLLESFDSYYYSHHGSNRPLPVYKIELNDESKTWVYINASTGEWIFSKTLKQRVKRWLYNGLHSLDFLFLIEHRPLWDIIVIVLCVQGAFMSFSSIVIAYRRLNIKRPKKRKRSV